MKIAICDDDKIFLSELKDKIYEYSNSNNWESVIDVFENGLDLVNSKTKYNLIILDYQMNEIDGLETAKLLRTGINKLTCIIFLTSYPDISIPAYSVDTYRFVVKTTLYEGLYNALDDFRNMLETDYNISIKSQNETITINTKDIVFIEVQNKYCFIHLHNGEMITTKITLASLENEIPSTHFYRIHKSYIINFRYVVARGNNFVKVQNHQQLLPISRNYYSKFKQQYYNYLKSYKI